MEKFRNSLLLKSTIATGIIASALSLIAVASYVSALQSRYQQEVQLLSADNKALLTESLKEPLRFSNISEASRVFSLFTVRSIEWVVIYDNNGFPIYTAGNAPDIDQLQNIVSDGWISSNLDKYAIVGKVSEGSKVFGSFKAGWAFDALHSRFQRDRRNALVLFSVAFLISALSIGTIVFHIVSRIKQLSRFILNYDANESIDVCKETDEIGQIYEEFKLKTDLLVKTERTLAERSKLAAIGELASQLAHDIRSPLSALNMIIGAKGSLTGEKSLVMRNAIRRIDEIAGDLLKKNNRSPIDGNPTESVDSDSISVAPLLIWTAVDSIVREKRLQYRDRREIEIIADYSRGHGLTSKIDSSALERVLSNLINNSVEAIGSNDGRITVSVVGNGTHNEIMISDSGKGIPSDILAQLGRRGATFGKNGDQGGTGLGLYHAQKTIQAVGGHLNIESVLGFGTTIRIILPMYPSTEGEPCFSDAISLMPQY